MMLLILRCLKTWIIYFIFCFLWSQEYSITGKIIDKKGRKPIKGVDVYIESLNIGTTSKKNGEFHLGGLPIGKLNVSMSIIGYEKKDTSVFINENSGFLGMFLLKQDTLKIKEIFVDGHGESQPMSFASNIDFIGDEYHKNLKTTLAQLLEEKPGLSVQSMGQATGTPVLRGYKTDRFLLTEDGVTVGDLSNTSIDHAVSVDMASYSRIKIIRGPETLLYGSNTIGGVIDVSRETGSNPVFDKLSQQYLFGTESSNNSKFANIIIDNFCLNFHVFLLSL